MDIQSNIILIDKLKDKQIIKGISIIINELFNNNNNLPINGIINIITNIIDIKNIIELIVPQTIVLIKLDS